MLSVQSTEKPMERVPNALEDSTAYIIAAKRTPTASFLGAFQAVKAPLLAGDLIKAIVDDFKVVDDFSRSVDHVFLGNVLQAGVGQAPARQAVLSAGLSAEVSAVTVNKVCGSGLQSIIFGAQAIALGDAQVVLAGGMENMSQSPHYVRGVRNAFRMGHQPMIDGMIFDGLWDPYKDFHMGVAAELCARKFEFTRELQDAYAIESFRRAQNAQVNGDFRTEIVPIKITGKKGGEGEFVNLDDGPSKFNLDKVSKLSPAFEKGGTITAANASSINDGASMLALCSGAYARNKKLQPLARIVGYAGYAQQPEWFTTSPVEATKRLLKRVGWNVGDVDLFEVNEAFAVVAMAYMKELEISSDKVNVLGGAISLGHPIGSSGSRIVVTLVHALKARGLRRGIASICIGGGEGLALAVEVL